MKTSRFILKTPVIYLLFCSFLLFFWINLDRRSEWECKYVSKWNNKECTRAKQMGKYTVILRRNGFKTNVFRVSMSPANLQKRPFWARFTNVSSLVDLVISQLHRYNHLQIRKGFAHYHISLCTILASRLALTINRTQGAMPRTLLALALRQCF